jgi:hypothetical protein
VCTNSAQTASTLSSCVSDLTFAAVSALSAGGDSTYQGILGLGKVATDNTNFVLEWAMQNIQYPVATINLGFDSQPATVIFGLEENDSVNYTLQSSST